MNTVEGIGYLAASLVLATFCMKSMDALRLAAIASNMAFIAYGYFGTWRRCYFCTRSCYR